MASKLSTMDFIPISDLNPEISGPTTRSIKAIVTLIWPYSSSNKNLTIRLADPDARLRLAKGQARVSFNGSSARAVYDAGIGSGDEVTLRLDGVEWVKDRSTTQIPGRGIDWELKFTERLVMEIRENESQKVSTIDIDHPPPGESDLGVILPTTEPDTSQTELRTSTSSLPEPTKIDTNKWSSPALIKRSRLSYGPLTASSYSILAEDDGTLPGKGRKRAKFGRKSSSWRYSSRSPSPEKSNSGYELIIGDGDDLEVVTNPVSKPVMLDESCQTMDVEQDAAESLETLSRQAVGIGHEVRGLMEGLFFNTTNQEKKSESLASMSSPPIPQLLINPVSQVDIDQRRNIGDVSSPPSPALLHPVSSEVLSLVSPLVSPSPGGFHPRQDVHVDWEMRSKNLAQSSQNLELHDLGFNTEGIPPVTERSYFKAGDKYGQWQSAVVVNDQSRGLHAQTEVEENVRYPELDADDENGLTISHLGPYFADDHNSIGPCLDDDSLEISPNIEREGVHTNLREETNASFGEEDEDDPRLLLAQSALSNLSSFGLSRSQSAQSEIVDLTEESHEEENPVDIDQRFERKQTEEESDIEGEDDEEGYDDEVDDTIKPNGDEDEPFSEEELEGDVGLTRYSLGFNPDGGSTSQYYGLEFEEESDNEEDLEKDFEDEELNSERPQDGQNPANNVYEVIDLTSSDENEAPGAEDVKGYKSEVEETDVFKDMLASLVNEEPEGEQGFEIGEEEGEGDEEDEEDEGDEGDEEDEGDEGDEEYEEYEEDEESEGEEGEGYEGGSKDDLIHIDGFVASMKDGRIEDVDEIVDADADVYTEDKTSNDDTKISNYTYQHHQELEAEDIEMRMDDTEKKIEKNIPMDKYKPVEHGVSEPFRQTILPGGPEMNELRISRPITPAEMQSRNVPQSLESTTSQTVVGRVPVARPSNYEVENIVTNIPEILADPSPRNELQTQANQDGLLPDVEEEWHDAPDIPVEVPQRFSAEGHDELMTKVGNTEKKGFIEPVSVEKITTAMVADGESKTQEDGYNPVLGVTQAENKTNFRKDHIKVDQQATSNYQLPTPNATQTTADLSTGVSFDFIIPIESEAESQTHSQATEALFVATPVDQNVLEPLLTTTNLPVPSIIPRRHMRTRSSTSQQSANSDGSSSIIMQDFIPSQGYDASAELALDSFASPTETNNDMRPPSPTALRTQLTKSLRTNLAEFTPLKNLRLNLERRVEVLAIATTSTHPETAERAKNGLRHYQVRFNITDPSLNSAVTEVQVFRPYREAIPVVRPGDGILLRSFIVKAEARRGFPLRSEDASSWAVFKADGTEETRGPPVEFDDAERGHIISLKHWFMKLDGTTKAKLDKANNTKSTIPEKGR